MHALPRATSPSSPSPLHQILLVRLRPRSHPPPRAHPSQRPPADRPLARPRLAHRRQPPHRPPPALTRRHLPRHLLPPPTDRRHRSQRTHRHPLPPRRHRTPSCPITRASSPTAKPHSKPSGAAPHKTLCFLVVILRRRRRICFSLSQLFLLSPFRSAAKESPPHKSSRKNSTSSVQFP